MSRIGKRPIEIPSGISVDIQNQDIVVSKDAKKRAHTLPDGISVRLDDEYLLVERKNNSKVLRSLHGLTRTIINNMIIGLDKNFRKTLTLVGKGKRVQLQGNKLILGVGFSHPVEFIVPEDIDIKIEKNTIEISGINKQKVGEIAAEIRDIQPPESYKGSGIRYKDEQVRKKAGKTAVGGGFTGTGK